MQNGSFLVAGASAKDNEDRDQSSTVLATGWDFMGVPGQELVECVRVTDCLAALPELLLRYVMNLLHNLFYIWHDFD